MAFHIRDKETDALVRLVAKCEGVGLTEAVKRAARARLAGLHPRRPLHQRIREIVEPLQAFPETGLKADKKFYDDLSGL
jgi:antitoxin VapB